MECRAKSGHKLGSDLSEILERRLQRSECSEEDSAAFIQQDNQDMTRMLSRKEIREYQAIFNRFDRKEKGFMYLDDLKLMMEELGAPQTHLSLKKMIQEVDTDGDGKISFQEFLMIYQKARAGDLENDGLTELAKITEVKVEEVGVGGAKNFFESKIEQLKAKSKFEEEILKEQLEKKQSRERKLQSAREFKQKHAFFEQVNLSN